MVELSIPVEILCGWGVQPCNRTSAGCRVPHISLLRCGFSYTLTVKLPSPL
jgi:hypothetical protein